MKASEILKITQGNLLSGSLDIDIDPSGISTDSRTIRQGAFFIALKGPNFDGNDFLETAFKKKAVGALVTKHPSRPKDPRKVIIKVKDTTRALEEIAGHHKMKFKIPVIGVTGSNGKTTVKEMIWRILSPEYNVLKNEGTKNNNIGVSQTLLKLNPRHQICVLEMGMNHRGEIALLSKIAKPAIAVITNIGPSHLEFLGNLKRVFEAKRELLESLDADGLAVLNGDDKFLSRIKNGRFKVLKFGFKKSNDFRITAVSEERDGLRFILNDRMKFKLNLLGVHNIYNASAAIAAASNFGISYESMRKALSDYRPGYMRLNLKRINGIDIIDDSYNSNPLSMKCALEALKKYPADTKWVVSGDMLELGRYGRYFHKEAGSAVASANAKGLLTFGSLSKATLSQARRCGMDKNKSWHCSSHDEIADILKKVAKRGDVVLIKGSRAMRMEKVLEKLKA